MSNQFIEQPNVIVVKMCQPPIDSQSRKWVELGRIAVFFPFSPVLEKSKLLA